jgi:hypothetical protein
MPSCQPKVIGPPGGAGTGLTVVGSIAYWRQFSKPTVLLRTSLNDDQTTEVTPPAEWINFFATTPHLFNDGMNVFSISNYCCAGVENALYGYYVSDGTWKFTNLVTPQNVSSFFYAARSLVISFDNGRFVRWYAPESLMTTKNYFGGATYASPMATDGTTIYAEVGSNRTFDIASFDGMTSVPIAKVPAQPYGSDRTLAVDATTVYFAALTKLMSADRKTPGDPKDVVDVTPSHPLDVLVDEQAVYWVDELGLHAIRKLDGGRVDLALFANDILPRAVDQIDQNTEYVVWTGRDGLTKVRKGL